MTTRDVLYTRFAKHREGWTATAVNIDARQATRPDPQAVGVPNHIAANAVGVYRALKVVTSDPRLRALLGQHDPKALAQADAAIAAAEEA